LTGSGHRVAVLAVDPSSARSGGSILGDKTRMEQLSRHPNAFIRPTPSHGALGGVARRTRETIRLVEAAGYDTVLVETVGVGQSETMVAEMTDVFLLLLAPAGGDELQGVKRGIMEIADLILVNKADGALKPVAEATRSDYASALHLMRRREGDPEGVPDALCVSAVTGDGLAEAWERVAALHDWRTAEGVVNARRQAQAVSAMERALEQGLARAVLQTPAATDLLSAGRSKVADGSLDPEAAAETLIKDLLRLIAR
ncbi:MAG: methylmalonyl Co-A mutase-associated GTPase MeaB, partial [Pseudomonadota bacterium]